MNDEELERLLRDSNPATTRADAPLTMRQQAILERIIAEPVPRRRSPGKLVVWVTAPLAAMLAIFVVVVAVLQPFEATPAAAFGPPPLVYEPTSQNAEEAISVAKSHLQEQRDVAEPSRHAIADAWNLAISDDGAPERTVVIAPSVTEVTWADDLSGSMKVTVGEPYFADGSDGPIPQDDSAEPGTVLDDRSFAPGEFPAQIPDPASLEPSAMQDLLASFAPDRSRAGDAFLAMHAVLNEWTLTPEQHSALLDALLGYDGITVLGTASDRLGRTVVGLEAPTSRPDQSAVLLVSASTGRIVGLESSVTTDDNALKVPAGTVVSYTLWKDQE